MLSFMYLLLYFITKDIKRSNGIIDRKVYPECMLGKMALARQNAERKTCVIFVKNSVLY